jgi:syntaxin 1B/2/3
MSYGGYQDQGNPYGTPYNSASNTEAGYGRGQQEQHELQTYQPGQYESYGQQQSHNNAPAASGRYDDYSTPAPPAAQDGHGAVGGGGAGNFFSRRDAIDKQLEALDKQINDLGTRQGMVFRSADPSRADQQLDGEVQQLRLTLTHIGDELRELKALARSPAELRHVAALRDSFKERTTRWQQQDSSYRQQQADQIARQARVVNPDVTEDEIRSILESGNEGGVFQQAVSNNT